MKHILIISNLFPPYVIGGAEKIAAQLAIQLSKNFKVTVITLSNSEYESVDQWSNIKVYRVAIKNIYYPFSEKIQRRSDKLRWHFKDAWNLAMESRVAEILAEEAPDAIHTHNLAGFSSAVWRAARSRSIRIVHTMHDYYLLCPKSTMFTNDKNCARQCFACSLATYSKKAASQTIDHVVSVSNFVLQRHLREGYFKNVPSSIIRNARDFEILPPRASMRSEIPRYGYIGRLAENKGIERLLRVFNEQSHGGTLFIAGTGEVGYVEYLRSRYRRENISFLGFVDPSVFFEKIDFNIVPSLWNDPFPTVVFESFYHSVPVIGSARGGITEIINDGVNGFLYEPDDDDALGNLFNRLASGRISYSALSHGAHDAAALYDYERFAAEYCKIFEELLC